MRFARKCIYSETSLVSYSLEMAFSRQENHFLTACAKGYFQEESRRETGGIQFRVNTTASRGCWGCRPTWPSSRMKLSSSLIILYRGSSAANFGNHFAVTVLSPLCRRELRDEGGKDRAKE